LGLASNYATGAEAAVVVEKTTTVVPIA